MNANTQLPGLSNAELLERRHSALPRGVGQAHGLFASRALNAEVWDVEGRRYIDFVAGIAVVNTGHSHPAVVQAVEQQLHQYSHTCFQVVAYDGYLRLAERLNALTPGDFAKKALLMSTGAEAVENAIKIARAATGRSGVIAFQGAFHGRTLLTLGLTGKIIPYKAGVGPFPAEIYHAPYPCSLHGVSVDDSFKAIEQLFKCDIEASRVAAIIVEPVQGEGGYTPAPPEFLQRLRALADAHGIVLIADEIQTGIARTGKLFAMEHSGVAADITTLAKGLGGGFPISAVVGRAEIMDAIAPGGLGSTYAGHPGACAAAHAVLDIVEAEHLCERATEIGAHMQTRLREVAKKHVSIGDVRGLGAMVAVEFFEQGNPDKPAAELTRAVIAEAFRRGLLLLSCGTYGNVLRLMAPLTIEQGTLDEGLDILAAAIDAVS